METLSDIVVFQILPDGSLLTITKLSKLLDFPVSAKMPTDRAGGEGVAFSALSNDPMECPMPQSNRPECKTGDERFKPACATCGPDSGPSGENHSTYRLGRGHFMKYRLMK